MGGSGNATSLNDRTTDFLFSHFPSTTSLDGNTADMAYARVLSRKPDKGDAARRGLTRDAGVIERDMLGDTERALPPRSTGINLDMDDIFVLIRIRFPFCCIDRIECSSGFAFLLTSKTFTVKFL